MAERRAGKNLIKAVAESCFWFLKKAAPLWDSIYSKLNYVIKLISLPCKYRKLQAGNREGLQPTHRVSG